MLLFVSLALLNGVLIGTSRAINGHLGKKVGPLRTSLWNHAVGFIFLSLLIGLFYRSDLAVGTGVPANAWLGGVLGVIFVALNSHIIPRLGASKTTSLVVAAQMLASVAIDSFGKPVSSATVVILAGAALIIIGVWLSASSAKKNAWREPAQDAVPDHEDTRRVVP
ncbi:DMT family transporter [Rhizobium rhizogenes]|uniref:DMT family transporter n=1 Tax=Rhizobium rhizogenes TaxID=359 RepID=UPI000648ADF9|nr:DMT family transporter [Rhizobium rhizogenes]